MLRNLDTALLRTFVTVADHANMTVAGNALHLTQGAISQQIKRLEQTLGCNLFQREARGLRLTPAGERLFGRAKRLLSLNDEIWSEMHADALAGRVRLGVPHDLVAHCLPSIVKAYAQAFPQVEIELVSASSPALTDALKRGDLDLALIEEPAGNNHGECLTIEPLVWVGAKAGAAYQKRPLPLSLVVDTCAFRPVILSASRSVILSAAMRFVKRIVLRSRRTRFSSATKLTVAKRIKAHYPVLLRVPRVKDFDFSLSALNWPLAPLLHHRSPIIPRRRNNQPPPPPRQNRRSRRCRYRLHPTPRKRSLHQSPGIPGERRGKNNP